jgi:hypothetical protein
MEKIMTIKEKIKDHIREHPVAYSVSVGTIVATITVLVMRSTTAPGGVGEANAPGGFSNTASFIFRNKQIINVTTVLDREGRGHPGWPVRNVETGRIFFSQREAATAFNIPEGKLSGHLNGKFPNVDGTHFERVSLI